MASKKITKKIEEEHFAIARALSLPVSTKTSVEVASFMRGKEVKKVKRYLQEVIEHKKSIPFKRYNRDVGHKPGQVAAGRFPEKAISYYMKLINNVEANAENKGLDVENLIISEVKANKGPGQYHYGRKRSRKMKNTHLFIKVVEK
ncbi:50S ribosomal protein L22 [Candidatus Woesearchaeota archaeon]|nr:50S ribosomal protein L22 [Candidatus Woesearchaeota archaeon]